jgi:hypothetical protein
MMEGSTVHRGIGYSISDLGDGKWRWKLHPKKEPGRSEMTSIISGDIVGTRDEAIEAAKKAIDAQLA